MDLGFDPALGGLAGASAALAKLVLYPLVQMRRRVDVDKDGAPDDGPALGSPYVHPDLHTPIVMGALAIVAVGVAVVGGEPLFPSLSSAMTGLLAARVGHEAVGAVRR